MGLFNEIIKEKDELKTVKYKMDIFE